MGQGLFLLCFTLPGTMDLWFVHQAPWYSYRTNFIIIIIIIFTVMAIVVAMPHKEPWLRTLCQQLTIQVGPKCVFSTKWQQWGIVSTCPDPEISQWKRSKQDPTYKIFGYFLAVYTCHPLLVFRERCNIPLPHIYATFPGPTQSKSLPIPLPLVPRHLLLKPSIPKYMKWPQGSELILQAFASLQISYIGQGHNLDQSESLQSRHWILRKI